MLDTGQEKTQEKKKGRYDRETVGKTTKMNAETELCSSGPRQPNCGDAGKLQENPSSLIHRRHQVH